MELPRLTPELLERFSEGPRECIEHLLQHKPERHDLSTQPRSRLAAVLVLLYENSGHLRVLLTTRSKALRTHAGQTALPGGRVDDIDQNFLDTAFREAYEEVGLPLNSPHIHPIAVLEPFVSLHRLIVTPIIAVLTHPPVLGNLKAAQTEVACIFTHPLEAILNPALARSEPLVTLGSEDWPYESELYNTSDTVVSALDNTVYRMHRFRSSASPIKGLTADILIMVADIAYSKRTVYERYAPEQLRGFTAMSGLLEQPAKWN